MKTSEFLVHLRSLGIRLSVEGGDLKIKAPKGALTAEVRRELGARKEELLAVLGAQPTARASASLPPIEVVPRDGRLPLSFTQERIWFMDQLEPGITAYNMWISCRLRGPLDVAALERAVGEIVQRHEVLRTTFSHDDGVPYQRVAPELGEAVRFELLGNVDDEPRLSDEQVRALLTPRVDTPFDLEHGPLLRPGLVRIGKDEHVLFIAVHHTVFDGVSQGVFFRELMPLYEAFSQGLPSPLPDLPVQYADYAAWQRKLYAESGFGGQLDYWKDVLGGELPVLDLPTDRPRPAIQTHNGATAYQWMTQSTIDALDKVGKSKGATLFMVLLAAYKAFLHRYTHQTDLLVGTAMANRNRAEVENLLGFFVNTLVMRTEVSGDPTFRELMVRVRDVCLGALENQDMPFQLLVDELQPERSLSHTPLFQTLFVLDEDPGDSRAMGSLELDGFDLTKHFARTDLVMTGYSGRDGFYFWAEYNTDLFDEPTIQRMLAHYVQLLESIARDPDRCISEIEMLSAGDLATVTTGWNDTAADFPREPLHAQFEAQVDRTPDATALVFPGGTAADDLALTYRELDARANQLARHLSGLGAGPEQLVGLCLERSPEMIVAQLAIQKTGAAYVPLDPGFPTERLAYMAADAGLELVVTTTQLAGLLPSDLALACLDTDAGVVAAASTERLNLAVDETARMYVIYTSGSTGKPKGVELEHRSVSNFMASMAREPGFGAGDSLLAVTTLSFDISVLETVLPLVTGGTLIVAPKRATTDGEELRGLLERLRPTVMQATPATWRMLLLAGWRGDPGDPDRPGGPGGLRILCGGEALPRELADELLPLGREVWNLYGPTEATIWSTLWRVEPGDDLSIGRPIANTQVYVLGDDHGALPIGVPGELWIAGDGLARGYLGRPELTDERFLTDPFSPAPGARMYRTGDLARWRADGTLECLGRIDNQVKVRGFRIELGEIESVLEDAAGVLQCVTVVREDRPGDQRLVAYYVPEAGELDPEELRAHASGSLPAYMLPSAFVALEAFPLTPNRKVDRLALLAREAVQPSAAREYVAPRSKAETTIAAIFAEVLGVERVGIHDDFFALGGNSLLTTQAVARLRGALRVDLPLRDMFEAPTVAGLAARAADAAPEAPEDRVRIERAARDDDTPIPLSFTQQRLWFLDKLEPGVAVYNVWMAWTLRGALDREAFARAVAEVVRRNEVLRTHFVEQGGIPAQAVAPADSIQLEIDEVPPNLTPDVWRGAVHGRLSQLVREPFDLAHGPLIRPVLSQISPGEHIFCLAGHHTVLDGWSLGRFRQELTALYGAFSRGAPSPLPEPELQYADYAVWQRDHLASEGHAAELEWWERTLSGAPVLELPTDHARPAAQSYRGANVSSVLPAPLVETLERLGAGEGATPFMVVLAAFDVLLSRYSGQRDLSIGSAVAGRPHRQLEELMGYFANTLVLRTDLSGGPTFRELLGRVRETCLGAYDHQDTPFEQLVERLAPERDLSYTPLFQAMFIMDDSAEADDRMGALSIDSFDVESKVARTDLTFWARRHRGGLTAAFEYSTDLFDQDTMERMLANFEVLLAAIAANPDQPVSSLPLLTGDERGCVLETWNDTAALYPGDPLHTQFERWVDEAPKAKALVFPADPPGAGGEKVSYAELDARANRIAQYLIAAGVRPDALVGLCLDRSIDMVVAALAILKTGAAYVPLDPGFPRQRLAYMVSHSGLRLVVTTSHLRQVLADSDAGAVCLDLEAEDIAAQSSDRPQVTVYQDQRAYVIYTSGSTGRPKGVEIEHRSVSNFLASMRREPGFDAGERLLAVTTLSFDISVLEILLPLTSGGNVVIAPKAAVADGSKLTALIDTYHPDVLQATPATWRMLILAGWNGDANMRIFCGGEALPRELADELLTRGKEVWNLYGPTETTIWSTIWRVEADAGPVLVGRPIASTRVFVVDEERQLVPIGVPGELLIGGAGLARGYLERPDLTQDRFVPDPFAAPSSEGRVYRTGDLVRWRRDGTLECLGRIDTQVKLRGFRIELGEIEAVISEASGVSQCVTVLREDRPGDQRLVAYFVAEPGAEPPETDALGTHAGQRLPAYMVPAAFVQLEALPLTPNGKIDRRALLAQKPLEIEPEVEYVPPRGELEKGVAAVFKRVLGIERVGARDDFFRLGGNSLLTTQALAQLRDAFEVELPLREVFESPTVAALAERIAVAAPGRTDRIELVPRGAEPLPLSFNQQRLWFLDQLEPGRAVYNLWMSWSLRGPLDRSAFERALAEVVRRHEVLRTRFTAVDGVPAQEFLPSDALALTFVDRPDGDDADSWREQVRADYERRVRVPFDLAAGPLFRPTLVRVDDEEHVFTLIVHHTAFDGWSAGRLRYEMTELYAAYLEGREPALAEPEIQYADYATWQRARLESEAHRADLEWWCEKLRGVPVLELPTDRPRPANQSYAGDSVEHRVPGAVLDELDLLARRERATPYMLLLAAFEVLLHRYSGQDDFAIGSAVAGRSHSQLEPLMGFFANTLVLRTPLDGDPSFRELIGRVRETALGAYDRQDTPFEQLVDELQPSRDLSYTPLFQAMFVLDDSLEPPKAMGNLTVEPFIVQNRVARTDLTLWADRIPGELVTSFEFATDLFERATIERLGGHYERLLRAVVADPDQPISAIPLFTADEREQILGSWNDTAADFPEQPIHAQVEAQVLATPDAVALIAGKHELTYRELDQDANRVARALIDRGVRPGALVGLCLSRSAAMVVTQLAIQKCGAGYVPLDPAFPAERLAYMVSDAGLELVVTTADLAELVAGPAQLLLDEAAEQIAGLDSGSPGVAVDARERMYVIYTSGSTGRPKGVEIEHRSVSNFLASMRREPGFAAGEKLLAVTTLSFDISVLETMLPLVSGGTLILATKEDAADAGRLAALLAEHRPDVMQATPATWRMLRLAGWQGDPGPGGPDGLGAPGVPAGLRMFCGGEALPRELAEELLPLGRELWNLYGPTEATIWSTLARVEPGVGAVSIGRPIANTQVYVLDAALQPSPVGVPGELWIAGDGLARGYLERPELTAERFIADPFSEQAGARMYRTGDLARWREDGTLECLGRVDNQVKLRGFRIELGEIEAVVAEATAVEQCVAVIREDRPGDQRLVAYFVATGEVDSRDLAAASGARLPGYMVPNAFVQLEALPLTPNGKIDRRALLALGPVKTASTVEHVPPRDAREEAVAAVWCEVLGLERVGVRDDFFELGGNSLLTTQAVARLRAVFGADLPLRLLFEHPTIEALAEQLGQASEGAGPRTGQVAIQPVARDGGPLPLSFTQQRLWFLDQLEPGKAVYNVWVGWTLRGSLDVDALERAVTEIVRRHEVLRTHFSEVDGIPSQEIAPPETVAIERLERPTGMDDEAWRARVEQRMADRVQLPFELAVGPLFKPALARITDEEHVFCLTAHHTVFDGWSMGRFRHELGVLYAAFARGQASPLPELELQYADYAAWQREFFAGQVYEDQLAWWREQLTGGAVLELPADRPRPAAQSYEGANATRELPDELMKGLEALGAEAKATPFMVLLTALDVLLHRYGGQEDVSVGSVVAGRARRELEELMGYFANTLVLRTDLSGDPSFRALLGRVREVCLGAYDHQDTPFEQLVAELQPARDMSFTPLFQALFVLDDSLEAERDLGGLEVDGFDVENHVARTDITLWARRHAKGLTATLEYAVDLFDHDTIERMLAHFEQLIASATANPDAPISTLQLLPSEERLDLVEARNPAATPFPEEPVHVQFEAQVDRTPEANALTLPTIQAAGDERVSYRELDQRANRLASHLRAQGVRTDDLVGLCLERSIEMVVAQLAILKAGAAYVPLDPLFPPDRLAYMVADSGLRHVVTASELEEMLPTSGSTASLKRIEIDTAAEAIAKESAARLNVSVHAHSRMYVIYTSGSTGRPKGVELEHRSVSNFLASLAREPGLSQGDIWLAVTTLSFDISVLEIFLPLVVGGTVAIATSDVVADGELLRGILERVGPQVMQATPATWRMLMLAGWEGDPGLSIFCGGEALPRELADELLPLGREVWNLYGPTETTIWSTIWKVRPGPEPVVIGHAIANTRLYVLDGHGNPTPFGVPGQLWIGGEGLARGYLDRPELTAERFVPDPFSHLSQGNARMYHTGDLARWRRDGTLECLGRVDNQVKLRGFRIELGEIESVLAEDPGVRQCVAAVREDTPGDQRLVAYLVLEAGAELDAGALRERARGRLPGYMIPSGFAALEALPLTPNGKVDRRALANLGQVTAAGAGGDYVAPESATEKALAGIWSELLGVEQVGSLDNFFDLGGHSLLSVQVTARVRDRLGVRITPRDLMLQNLGQLAAVVEERAARETALAEERHGPGRRLIDALTGIFRRRQD